MQLDEGSAVELTVEDGRLLVTPIAPAYRSEELVAGIDDANRHAETDWGPPTVTRLRSRWAGRTSRSAAT